MILSQYRNPPYRTPTPKSTTSPPPDATPKRKRSQGTESGHLSLDVDAKFPSEQSNSPGSKSPRTKVAEKLRDLDIQQVRPATQRTSEQHVRRKRLKRNPGVVKKSSSSDSLFSEDAERSNFSPKRNKDVGISEVNETPDCHTRTETPPPANSSEDANRELEELPVELEEIHVSAPQLPSSSPQILPSTPSDSSDIVDRSVSPLPLREELTPDQAALTWQDDEITGHELDPSADDDGEGINGIGFKPTPAIAFARRQRRKHQVNEWKAREAREARQKRFERRRGAANGAAAMERDTADSAARMVRFVGVG